MTKLQPLPATTCLLRAQAAGAALVLPAIWKWDLKGHIGLPLPRGSPNMPQAALCHVLLCTEVMGKILIVLIFDFLPLFSPPVLD